MEPEEAELRVLLLMGFLLAIINEDLAVVSGNTVLLLEVDLVDCILLVVEELKEENLEDNAGFNNTFFVPLKTGTFDA